MDINREDQAKHGGLWVPRAAIEPYFPPMRDKSCVELEAAGSVEIDSSAAKLQISVLLPSTTWHHSSLSTVDGNMRYSWGQRGQVGAANERKRTYGIFITTMKFQTNKHKGIS